MFHKTKKTDWPLHILSSTNAAKSLNTHFYEKKKKNMIFTGISFFSFLTNFIFAFYL